MVYGRAQKPYVTRVLVPLLVRAVVAITPPEAAQTEADAVRQRLVHDGKPEWLDRHPFEFAVARAVLFLLLLGFAFALRELARSTLGGAGCNSTSCRWSPCSPCPACTATRATCATSPPCFLFTLGCCYRPAPVPGLPRRVPAGDLEQGNGRAAGSGLVHRCGEARGRPPGIAAGRAPGRGVAGGAGCDPSSRSGTRPARCCSSTWRAIWACSARPNYFMFRAVGNWLVVPVGLNFLYLAAFVWALAELKRSPQFLRDAFWMVVPMVVFGCCSATSTN